MAANPPNPSPATNKPDQDDSVDHSQNEQPMQPLPQIVPAQVAQVAGPIPPGSVTNSGQMGNVNTGNGMLWNIGEIDSNGGPIVIGNQPTVIDRRQQNITVAPTELTIIQLQHRRVLLKTVRATWIDKELDEPVYKATRVVLNLCEKPGAVLDLTSSFREHADLPASALLSGTSIVEVYNRTDGTLLILGAPGAGKTSLLLELARTLLDTAGSDVTRPLPVVLPLSSWAEKRPPFAGWLVTQLSRMYVFDPKIWQPWVDKHQLLLLLDGLDEVPAEHQPACVQAINAYRREHGVPVIVSSRETEYDALSKTTPLLLNKAIVIQPLTSEQINKDYLEQTGPAVRRVFSVLVNNHDPDLQELLHTPLMLNILSETYNDVPLESLNQDAIPINQKQVWAAYVQRMLERKRGSARYTPQQTQQWLAWLAGQMKAHDESIFYIEHMQPDWRLNKGRWAYKWLVEAALGLGSALVIGLFGGLDEAMEGTLDGGLSGDVGSVLLSALEMGLMVGLISGLCFEWIRKLDKIDPPEIIGWSWGMVWYSLRPLSLTGIAAWLGIGFIGGLLNGLGNGWSKGWAQAGLISAVGSALTEGLGTALNGVLFIGVLGMILTIFSALREGLSMETLDDRDRGRPNQGMWQSARNGLRSALIIGVIVGLGFGISFGIGESFDDNRLLVGAGTGLVFGPIAGLVAGLFLGWAACVQHLVLRLLLWRSGMMPLNMIPFLDYAAERILLRKVGGGYIFVHRLLLEYFAGLEKPWPPDTAAQ
jgi:hypothetical protein